MVISWEYVTGLELKVRDKVDILSPVLTTKYNDGNLTALNEIKENIWELTIKDFKVDICSHFRKKRGPRAQ